MARLKYSNRALDDLERLISFLQEVAPESADSAFDAILQALEVLVAHPAIGRRVGPGLRELVISLGATGYLALYDFDAARDLVHVLRIRHQREAGYID